MQTSLIDKPRQRLTNRDIRVWIPMVGERSVTHNVSSENQRGFLARRRRVEALRFCGHRTRSLHMGADLFTTAEEGCDHDSHTARAQTRNARRRRRGLS